MLQINNSSELQYFLDVLDLIGQSTDDYLYFMILIGIIMPFQSAQQGHLH